MEFAGQQSSPYSLAALLSVLAAIPVGELAPDADAPESVIAPQAQAGLVGGNDRRSDEVIAEEFSGGSPL